jgi:hypothetical protein
MPCLSYVVSSTYSNLSIYLSIYPPTYLSLSIYPSTYLSLCLSIYLSVYGSAVLCWTLSAFLSFLILYTVGRSRDSVVGIGTGYGLDDRRAGVRVPIGSRIFSSPRCLTGSGDHPTSYTMGTGGSFPGGKAAGA